MAIAAYLRVSTERPGLENQRYAVGEYWRIFSGEYSHNPYFREKIMADDISIGEAQ